MSSERAGLYDTSLLASAPQATREQRQEGYDPYLFEEKRGNAKKDIGSAETGYPPNSNPNTHPSPPHPRQSALRWFRTSRGILVLVLLALVIIAVVVGGAVGGTRHASSHAITATSSGKSTSSSSSSSAASSNSQGVQGVNSTTTLSSSPTTSATATTTPLSNGNGGFVSP